MHRRRQIIAGFVLLSPLWGNAQPNGPNQFAAFAQQGQRIDAIKKYAAATGEDLGTAKSVVDMLAPRQRQAE